MTTKHPGMDFADEAGFADLQGFAADDLDAAFAAFRRSAERIVAPLAQQQRPARPPPPALVAACRAALDGVADPRAFFTRRFVPRRLRAPGFLTGYYEVEVEARRISEPGFETPVLARPEDLVTLNEAPLAGADGAALAAARRRADGRLEAFPERRDIEDGFAQDCAPPLAFLRDQVELFLLQVQGSARLRFPDGSSVGLTYAGRNGHPYTSIGRAMIQRGLVAEADMSLETLKRTLRDMGLGPGEAGRRLMQENKSYVFFELDETPQRALGPIGGQGCALTPLRSIAVDRNLWSYGLPFWIAGQIPWERDAPSRFARLMIAQDTGSAILGAARADLYFGTGAEAGARAGGIRHAAEFFVLAPKAD